MDTSAALCHDICHSRNHGLYLWQSGGEMSVKSTASAAVSKVVAIFRVNSYLVSYKKYKTSYELRMVLPPRVVEAAAHTGVNQSHSSRQTVVNQFVDGVRRSYPDAQKFKLELFQYSLLSFGEPRRATLRQHVQYFVLARLGYPGALLVTETR